MTAPGGPAAPALEACLRDILGLLALPTLWTGRDARSVVGILFDALEAIVSPIVSYAALTGTDPPEVLRVHGRETSPDAPGWRDILDGVRTSRRAGTATIEHPSTGPVRVVTLPIGYYGSGGLLLVGADRATFLSETEAMFLRAALTLGATGLETARAMREREEALQAKDEFLAMLAHELRNPLGVIINALSVLGLGDHHPAEAEQARALIQRQTTQLARLLDDLLDVARITSGRIHLTMDPVDVRAAVDRAVESERHRLAAKRQRVTVALPDEPVVVAGDAVRLQQIVSNLLSNACKYTSADGDITISLTREAAQAVLRVRDSGAGIPKDKLDFIFDLFTQVNPTLGRSEGGLGVGLTLVRKIAELHGGSVRAHSEGPGRGAEFVVRLPAMAAPLRSTGPTAVAPAAARHSRIVVVEDNADAREILVTMLRLHGHEVSAAATGEAGISAANAERPDVALIDIGLPDLDGYEVGRRLRKDLGRGIQLVALTGYGQPQDRQCALDAGFDEHLVKPVDPAKLNAMLCALQRTSG